MRKTMLLAIGASLLLSAYAKADSGNDENVHISDYLAALALTTHGQSTESDIDAVLAYYSDEVVYEHPRFGIRLEGKEAQRHGMVAFLQSYAGGPTDSRIAIVDFMKGDGVVTLRLEVAFLHEREGAVQRVSREQIRVLEFSSGRISRVIDYW